MRYSGASVIVGLGMLVASCAGERAGTRDPASAISWSGCQQVMDSERIVAHTCDAYSWVRFARPVGDHADVVAEASLKAARSHGWTAETVALPQQSVPAADAVSAIVFRSREAADELIKVTIVSTRPDERVSTGYAVTVCSREYDAYREPVPDAAAAVQQVSGVCAHGSARLRGL